jgi:hypothetical protein
MRVFKCSESDIKVDANGNIGIVLPDGAGVLKISLPESLAMNAKACSVVADQEALPPNLIENIQGTIESIGDIESLGDPKKG